MPVHALSSLAHRIISCTCTLSFTITITIPIFNINMKFNIFVLSIIGSSNGEHFSRRLRKLANNEQPSAAKNLEQQRTLTDDSSMSVEQVSYLEEQYSLSMEFGRGGGSSGRGGAGSSKNPGKGKECSRKDQQIGAFLPTNGNVGIMFKIEAKEDLIIDGFSYLPDPDLLQSTSSYNDTITIFTKCGDYVGDESIEEKWDKESTSFLHTKVSLPLWYWDHGSVFVEVRAPKVNSSLWSRDPLYFWAELMNL